MKIIKPTITGVLLVGLVSFVTFGISAQTAFETSNNNLTNSVAKLKHDTVTISSRLDVINGEVAETTTENKTLQDELQSTEGFLP